MDYLQKKLPLTDEVLVRSRIVEYASKAANRTEDLRFFLKKFSTLLPAGCTEYQLLEEFAVFQCSEDVKVPEDKTRYDEVWSMIGEVRDESGQQPFKNLAKVMKGILVIPHSSAHCERVFSTVRKNRTDQCASLSDDTLEALLVLKSNPLSPLNFTEKMGEQELREVKSCYRNSLLFKSASK